MGSIFRMPFVYTESAKELLPELKNAGIISFATSLKADSDMAEVTLHKKIAFLIGNEANGLKDETVKSADFSLKIPMEGKVESLNAAISAAVLVYHYKLTNGVK